MSLHAYFYRFPCIVLYGIVLYIVLYCIVYRHLYSAS